MDMIDMMSYRSGYKAGELDGFESGYEACREEIIKKVKNRRRQKKHALYFVKQKLLAIGIFILSFIVSAVLDWDMTFLLFSIPVSTFLFFSKQMWLLNEFFYEIEEEEYTNYD